MSPVANLFLKFRNTKFTKNHYKLYKSGKLWVAALVTATVLGGAAVTTTAHAAENTATTTNAAAVSRPATELTTSSDQTSASGQVTAPVQATVTQPTTADGKTSPVETGTQLATNQVKQGNVTAGLSEGPSAIDTDQQLQDLFTENTDLAKQLLGRAAIFHIFSKETTINADTNGNIATGNLVKGPEFGTRGDSQNRTKKDIYYIGNITNIGANGFRTGDNFVVLGDDSNVKFNGDQVLVNGVRLDHLKKADVRVIKDYVDIDSELASLAQTSDYLMGCQQSADVVVNLSDMNNRYIDVSKATGRVIIVNLDANLLGQSQPITIKGLSSDKHGAVVIINVKSDRDTIDWSTQTKLVYDDGTQISPNESHSKPNHVLWNFGSGTKSVNVNSGYLLGSVLAANGTLTFGVNADGNLIARSINIAGGESHRWDLWAPEFIRPVFPHDNDEFVYPPSNNSTEPGKPSTPGTPTEPVTPSTPEKPTEPAKPSTPAKPTEPAKPSTPAKPTEPAKPSTPNKPTEPVNPSTPEKPTEPAKPSTSAKPTEPAKPSTPEKPTEPAKPSTPNKPTEPAKPSTPEKPTEPAKPSTTNKPTEPATPSTPEKPTEPVTPSTPEKPTEPATPSTPEEPTEPVNPSTPEKPTEPVNPSTPVVPEQPTDQEEFAATHDHVDYPKKDDDHPVTPTESPVNHDDHRGNTTTPVKVDQPQQDIKATTVTGQPTAGAAQGAATNTGLPQTGSQRSVVAQAAGLLILAFLGILGLRKKKD